MKKIVYITGTRAEYGVMKNLLQEMHKSNLFDLSLIVTGMHLSHAQGYTLTEVQSETVPILGVVDAHIEEVSMVEALGHEILGIANLLQKVKPDLILVAGDRDEALAGATVGAHLHIPVAHISGGDMTGGGTIDDRIRHAITRFADVHFATSDQSAKNLVVMGENKELVFSVGTPGMDDFTVDEDKKNAIAERFTLDRSKPILLVSQHPVTSQAAEAGSQMHQTMEALTMLGLQTILIYPNADTGNADMIAEIKKYEHETYLRTVPNLPREDFAALMSIATAMVGNSSGALDEAPSLCLPAVNIGSRQEGRERAQNIIDAPHDHSEIVRAIQKAISDEYKKALVGVSNPHQMVNTNSNIIDILNTLDLSPDIVKKKTVLPQ